MYESDLALIKVNRPPEIKELRVLGETKDDLVLANTVRI
jgi:hypothetical protein